MKITDLLVESNQQTTEAPMGFLKSMGNKVAGAFGSGQAQGRLETGKEANQLKKEFDVFLGKTGQQPTGDMIVKFLKQKGYPTSSAERLLSGELTANVRGAAPQQQAQQPVAAPQPSQPTQADIAKRVKANVGKSAAASKGSNFGQQPEQPAQPAPNVIGNFVKQQMGDNPITMKPAPQKAPQAQQPAAQPAARAQSGGKVAGQVSQTPNAIKKRQARAVKRRTGHPADDNPNIQLGTESLVHEGSTLFRQALNLHRMLKEALSAKQIDAVFLAAVQDKQKSSGQQQPAAQPTTTEPQSNAGSTLLKHAAAAYDGMRGASYGATKVGQETPGKELKDTSGRVPANIMSQINSLTNKQRAQLRKELDKA